MGFYCLRQVWFFFQRHSTSFNLCVEEQWHFTLSLSACYPMPNYLFEQSLSAAVHIGFERAAVDSDIWGLLEYERVEWMCVYRSRCLCVDSFSPSHFLPFARLVRTFWVVSATIWFQPGPSRMEFTCECVGLATSNQLVRDTLQPLALRRLEMVQPKVNIWTWMQGLLRWDS